MDLAQALIITKKGEFDPGHPFGDRYEAPPSPIS